MSPQAFEAKWAGQLASGALVRFHSGEPSNSAFIHSAIADEFVESLGLTKIGFNWELLDAYADLSEPRCALGELTKAFSHDIANPSNPWLAAETAQQCASDFLSLFNPAERTLVSNRYDGLWNPISGGAVEWGFVGYDTDQIALLLLVAK